MHNVLTLDVEDWYQGLELPPERWGGLAKRVERDTRAVLDLLDASGSKATFFFLGRVAADFPGLVREVDERGHEVGCHGNAHGFAYRQGPDEFRRDLRAALDRIRQSLGRDVTSYRAPFFSLTRQTPWLFEALASEGIRIDSSLFPVHNYRYGIPGAPRTPFRVRTGSGLVDEYPISTVRLFGVNVPFAGGFYLRFWPYVLVRAAARRVARGAHALVFYFHPWEIAPGGADPPGLPWRVRATHHHGRARAAGKLGRLLGEFRFMALREAQKAVGDLLEADPGFWPDFVPPDPYEPVLRDLTREAIRRAAPAPGRRVLDLGCGKGHSTLPLAAAGATVFAVDASRERILEARDRVRGLGLEGRVRFAAMDVEALALRAGCVDAIHSRSVLQYADAGRVIRECGRVLAPGGSFSFAEVLASNPFAVLYRVVARRSIRPDLDPLMTPRSHLPFERIGELDAVGAGVEHAEFVLFGYLAWILQVVFGRPRLFAVIGACLRGLDRWLLGRWPCLRHRAWMTVAWGPPAKAAPPLEGGPPGAPVRVHPRGKPPEPLDGPAG